MDFLDAIGDILKECGKDDIAERLARHAIWAALADQLVRLAGEDLLAGDILVKRDGFYWKMTSRDLEDGQEPAGVVGMDCPKHRPASISPIFGAGIPWRTPSGTMTLATNTETFNPPDGEAFRAQERLVVTDGPLAGMVGTCYGRDLNQPGGWLVHFPSGVRLTPIHESILERAEG